MSNNRIYLYPVWLRIWHALNALSILILMVTGISMQFSNIEYPLIRFDIAVMVHNFSGVLLIISYLFFILSNMYTENNKQYKLHFKGLLNRLLTQAAYYLNGYFKNEVPPYPPSKLNKFNPLQKVSYFITMYVLVPIIILTGLALLYPEMIVDFFIENSGIAITAILHALIGFMISIFLIIHLYVITIGKQPIKNFKSIINGYHEVDY